MKRHSNANHYLLTWFIFIRYGWASVGWTKEKTTHRETHTQQMLVWDHIDISLSTECGHVIIELHSTNFRLHQKTYWNGATNQSAARERSEKKTTTTNRKSWDESRKELQNGVHLQHHWKTISRTSNRQCYRNHIFKWQIIQYSHRSKFRLLLTKNESKQIKFNERCVVSVLFYLSLPLCLSVCFSFEIQFERCTRTQLNCCTTKNVGKKLNNTVKKSTAQQQRSNQIIIQNSDVMTQF